jgi:hypothetical protein
MSLWPEHPQDCAPTRTRTVDALLRLAEGPNPEQPPSPYVIGVAREVLTFPLARWEHFPGPGSPEFLLVWTPRGSHCFHYHEVDYAFVPKDK